MFVARGIWCLADVSSVSPSSEQSCVDLQGIVLTCMALCWLSWPCVDLHGLVLTCMALCWIESLFQCWLTQHLLCWLAWHQLCWLSWHCIDLHCVQLHGIVLTAWHCVDLHGIVLTWIAFWTGCLNANRPSRSTGRKYFHWFVDPHSSAVVHWWSARTVAVKVSFLEVNYRRMSSMVINSFYCMHNLLSLFFYFHFVVMFGLFDFGGGGSGRIICVKEYVFVCHNWTVKFCLRSVSLVYPPRRVQSICKYNLHAEAFKFPSEWEVSVNVGNNTSR